MFKHYFLYIYNALDRHQIHHIRFLCRVSGAFRRTYRPGALDVGGRGDSEERYTGLVHLLWSPASSPCRRTPSPTKKKTQKWRLEERIKWRSLFNDSKKKKNDTQYQTNTSKVLPTKVQKPFTEDESSKTQKKRNSSAFSSLLQHFLVLLFFFKRYPQHTHWANWSINHQKMLNVI